MNVVNVNFNESKRKTCVWQNLWDFSGQTKVWSVPGHFVNMRLNDQTHVYGLR